VAAVQYRIEGGQSVSQFLKKFENLTLEATQGGARLVIFPELLTLDAWPKELGHTEKEVIDRVATQFTPELHKLAIELSLKHQIAILAGSTPRNVGKRIFNTAFLALPDGRKISQDKLFLTPWEKKLGWSTGQSIQVFDAPWGRTAILICFDSEFPVISNLLAKYRPEVFLIPSMTESEAGLNRVRWTAQARSVEHHAYAIVAGTVGSPMADWTHFGQSVILSPWEGKLTGLMVSGKKNSPEIVYGDLDLPQLRASRLNSGFVPAKEQDNRNITVQVEH
jgi:predicted amidohydrolase